jgi:hypothetical protein
MRHKPRYDLGHLASPPPPPLCGEKALGETKLLTVPLDPGPEISCGDFYSSRYS